MNTMFFTTSAALEERVARVQAQAEATIAKTQRLELLRHDPDLVVLNDDLARAGARIPPLKIELEAAENQVIRARKALLAAEADAKSKGGPVTRATHEARVREARESLTDAERQLERRTAALLAAEQAVEKARSRVDKLAARLLANV